MKRETYNTPFNMLHRSKPEETITVQECICICIYMLFYHILFLTRMGSSLPDASPAVSMVVSASAITNKKGKVTGPDGLAMEAFMYGCLGYILI